MKLLVQRVKYASVEVDSKTIGKIDKGFLVLLGITHTDDEKIADYLVEKLLNLRIFNDEDDKMNLSLKDVEGELLVISQFTLYADTKKSGNRPSFSNAARPEKANELYEYFIQKCREKGVFTQTGKFGADMKVELLNDGPVTIMLKK